MGLEIAPGNEVEDLSLIEDVGNAWNHIPQAREWTALDPKCALVRPMHGGQLPAWRHDQPAVLWFQRSVFRPAYRAAAP